LLLARSELENPGLKNNWRWQHMMRCYYDPYTAQKIYEQELEIKADAALEKPVIGSDKAMDSALRS
jgi:hypothetical protein